MTNPNPKSKEKRLKSGGIELRKTTIVCSACRTRTMNAYGALQQNGKRIKRFVKIEGGTKIRYRGILCTECSKGIRETPGTKYCAQCGTSIDGDWYMRTSHVAIKEGAKLRFCSNICEKAFDLFTVLRHDTIEGWQNRYPKPNHSPVFRTSGKPSDETLLGLISHLNKEQTRHLATELAKAATKATWAISRYTQSGWHPLLETNAIRLTDSITVALPLPLSALTILQENEAATHGQKEHERKEKKKIDHQSRKQQTKT